MRCFKSRNASRSETHRALDFMFWHVSIQIFLFCLVQKLHLGMKISLRAIQNEKFPRSTTVTYLWVWMFLISTFMRLFLESASSIGAFYILHLRKVSYELCRLAKVYWNVSVKWHIASESRFLVLDVIFHRNLTRKNQGKRLSRNKLIDGNFSVKTCNDFL